MIDKILDFLLSGWGFIITLAIAIVVSIVWVNLVYDGDYRCLFAECRIIKDGR